MTKPKKNQVFTRVFTDKTYRQSQEPSHIKEWEKSAIAPDLIKENLVSLKDDLAFSRLLRSDLIPRRNTGVISSGFFNKYRHLWYGGQYCKSHDPITKEEQEYIQFKPDRPRQGQDGKLIKYEGSPKMKAGIILPYMPRFRWQLIADKLGIEITDDDFKSGFWEWVIRHSEIEITITEGAKKALSLLSQNIVAIGLPGVWMGTRKISCESVLKEVHPMLKLFCHKKRVFNIAFDSDNPSKTKTIISVSKAISSLGSSLMKEGCKVNILSWDYKLGKGIDDVLYSSEDKDKILFDIYSQKKSFNLWSCHYLMRLSRCDKKLKTRYLGDSKETSAIVHDLIEENLIMIKSPQSTGKSHFIASQVKKFLYDGTPVLVIVHLESLAKALSKIFGVAYRTECDEEKKYYGFTLCLDSCMEKSDGITPRNWEDCVVIIDEVEQVLEHGFFGNTAIADYRPTIFTTLHELLKVSSKVICMDADLSDISVNFFEQLTQRKAFIIENDYKYEGQKFFSHSDPTGLISLGEQSLAFGEKVFITTTSQQPKSQTGTIALENYYRERFPHLKILRIDSETLINPDSDAFGCLSNLNSIMVNYDLVICSPSLQTGVSIDIRNHFSKVIAFCSGNVSSQKFLQQLWRVRDENVERHFYCKKRGFNFVGNSSCSPNDVLNSNNTISQVTMSQLGAMDCMIDDVDPIFLKTWAKLSARQNAMNRCLIELLEYLIISQGHELIRVDSQSDKEKTQEIKANALDCNSIRQSAILESKNIDAEEKKALELKGRSKGITASEQHSIAKFDLKTKWQVDQVDQELLELDDNGSFLPFRLTYYLTLGEPFLIERDCLSVSSHLSKNNGKIFSFDVNRKTLFCQVKSLAVLKVLDFISEVEKADRLLSNNDPLLIDFEKHVMQFKDSLKSLGIFLGQYRISNINKLLTKLGYKLRSQKVKDGERFYRLDTPNIELRDKILTHWQGLDLSKNIPSTNSHLNFLPQNETEKEPINDFASFEGSTNSLYINQQFVDPEIVDPDPEIINPEMGDPDIPPLKVGDSVRWHGREFLVVELCDRVVGVMAPTAKIKIPNYLLYSEVTR